MKNVIITGADGFVGSYTVKHFIDNGCNVLALDMGETPQRLSVGENLKYMQCDIFDTKSMLDKVAHGVYDTFVHFAWAGSSGEIRSDYNIQMKNALATVDCLKAAKVLGCTRFVCAGSIMEYEVEAAIHNQGSHPGLKNIYGMAKHVAHCMAKAVAEQIGIELMWPMITNAYGVGEFSPRFINTTLRKIINGEPLQFTSGTQNYDFVYVTDVAQAFYKVALMGKPNCEYMIGSGDAKPLKEFILEMVKACAPSCIPNFGNVQFMGTNLPIGFFSIKSIVEDCSFKPEISFTEGTKQTMIWLKSNNVINCR